MNLKNYKKITTAMLTLAMVVGSIAPFGAKAATVAELQAQINALMAQLAAMQGQTTVTYTFTMNLTMGSTGADVVALQTFLESKGYLVMPIGVAKGYFGALTRSALARFQAANGIAPAVGYFGPITRAKVNQMVVITPGGPVVIIPGTPATGTEGQLRNPDKLGSISGEDIDEGDSKAEVIGIEFEADDSDMTIDRIDVDFSSSGTGSKRLNRYIDSVSIWLDGKKLAEVDVDDLNEKNDIYSVRFTNLKGVVKENATGELIVAIDAVSNVDSSDLRTWTVTIPEDGIRATDTKGISDTYFGSDYSETFTIGEATSGKLTLSDASNNPDARDVEVSENNTTTNITLLSFELKAREQDIVVTDIPVELTVSAGTPANAFRTLSLYQGSTLIKSKSVSTTTVTFDDLDIDIDEGDTESFTIKATVNKTGTGGFVSGVVGSALINGSNIEAEDSSGDDVSVTGDARGENVTFRTEGITTSLTSVTESKTSGEAGVADRGTYVFKFKATAFGEDMFISATSSGSIVTAVTYTVDGSATTSVSAILTSNADKVSGGTVFKIDEGDTEDFTLTIVVPGQDAFTTVEVTEIHWGTDSSNPASSTTTVENWESDPLFLSDNV